MKKKPRYPMIWAIFLAVGLVACKSPTPTPPTPTPSPSPTLLPSTHTATPTLPPTHTPTPPPPTIPPTSPFQPDAPEGWCWQEVLGLVNALNDVFFWDAQTGWAVGEKGAILHTDDGGETWQWQDSPVAGSLEHVVFVDAQTGWISGPHREGKSLLLQTQDGGRTWLERPVPFLGDYARPEDMIWTDDNHGWLLKYQQLFHTADGGQTWQEQPLPLKDPRLYFITSVDAQHVWLIANDSILRTTNGGETWTAHAFVPGSFAYSLAFVDAETGWAAAGNAIMHTTDGGQTWQVQHTHEGSREMEQLDFVDARIGWAWNFAGNIWRTTDGGATWEMHEMPEWSRHDVAFVDARRGWAVGIWRWGEQRSTIAYTDDGGVTWQLWDQHIAVPPLAYVTAARLTTYLEQRDAPLEALIIRLLSGPCPLGGIYWMPSVLHNLGWDGAEWIDPPDIPEGLSVQRLDADLDQDGVDEVVLYLQHGADGFFAGVLDWDGAQWQVAWSNQSYTRFLLDSRVRLDDLDTDGHPELLLEVLHNPYHGAGVVGEDWYIQIIRCEHLKCHLIWKKTLGSVQRDCFIYGPDDPTQYKRYRWFGSDYHFVDDGRDIWPAIELWQHGLYFYQTSTDDPISSTLEIQTLSATQTVYRWDGAQYTPTVEIELNPSYDLDTHPVTETVDMDGDGDLERVVHRWLPDCRGLWQTLSFYDRDAQGAWQPTQVFTTAFTGASSGLSLQDVDDDGRLEVVACATSFFLRHPLEGEWPSMQPRCTIYGWDYVSRRFKPRFSRAVSEP